MTHHKQIGREKHPGADFFDFIRWTGENLLEVSDFVCIDNVNILDNSINIFDTIETYFGLKKVGILNAKIGDVIMKHYIGRERICVCAWEDFSKYFIIVDSKNRTEEELLYISKVANFIINVCLKHRKKKNNHDQQNQTPHL